MGLLGRGRFSAPPAIQPPLKHRINPANAEVLKSTTRETSCFFFRTAVMVRYADFSTRNHRKKTNKETKKIRKVQNSDVDHADQLLSIGFKFLSIDLKAFVSFYCKARLFWPSRQCDSTHVSYHWLRSKKPTGENKRRHTAGRNFAPVEITISTG